MKRAVPARGRSRAGMFLALRALTALALVAGVLSAGTMTGAAPAVAQTSSTVAPDVITVEGRGFGHGNGLSQWGALGYALEHRWTSDRIVKHFYGGTSVTQVSNSDIWVHLTRNRGELLVTSGSEFSVADRDFGAGLVVRVGVTSGGSFWVRQGSGCGRRGELVVEGLSSSTRRGNRYVEVLPSNSDYHADDQSKMLVMIYCTGSNSSAELMRVAYRGALAVVNQGGPVAVNRLPLEEYLRGVVSREGVPEWGALGDGRGIAALEAQSIAARSYVLRLAVDRQNRGRFTDTCDYHSCQVYGGAAVNGRAQDHGTRYIHTNTAIANTAGKVLTKPDGSIAFTEFHSSSGGWTAPVSEGSHFPDVEDLGDATAGNRNHAWIARIRRADIEAKFPGIGRLRCIEVTQRNGKGAWGGRTRGVRIVGTKGVHDFGGGWNRWARDQFRRAFSLKSDWYRFPQFPGSEPCAATTPDPEDPDDGDDVSGGGTAKPGLWLLKSDGTVLNDGSASHHGNGRALSGEARYAAMAGTSGGKGYWLAASTGEIQAFGNAVDYGDLSGVSLTGTVTAMAARPDGKGYWLLSDSGAVFAFGRAAHFGGLAHMELGSSAVDIESTPTGGGYWMALGDGRVVAFGDAQDAGCPAVLSSRAAGVSLAAVPDGKGYWLASADTAVHALGSAELVGDRSDEDNRLQTVAIAATAGGKGYWLVWSDGTSFNYGDAPDYRTSRAGTEVVAAEAVH